MRVSFLKNMPLEAVMWMGGLVVLAFADIGENHFTICPFALFGIDWCPGCGLGRSVHEFLHGNIASSFAYHPLGVFAVIVLSFRIFTLIKQYIQYHGKSY